MLRKLRLRKMMARGDEPMTTEREKAFGRRLKAAREASGFTQSFVAEKLGVTRQAVGQWESAETSPNPETLRKLADLYNVSADYLLGRETNSVILATRGMPLPPFGAEYLTEEELAEIEERTRAFHEFEVRRRLKEKGVEI